jgi:hypothetical protein
MSSEGVALLQLRIPVELKRALQDASRRDDRSMNAQIVRHLREIYGGDA